MNDEFELAIDDGGSLVLQEPSIEVPTVSGNPAHGVASGTFRPRPGRQPGKKDKEPLPGAPPESGGPRPDEERRRDAIADAARTLDDLSPEGVRELVVRRWRGARPLTQDDLNSFSRDAMIQRMNDLVDTLDARMRRLVQGQSNRVVKVEAPRGWVRRTMRGMDDTQVVRTLQRLRERGWSARQVQQHIVKPFDDERKRMIIPQVGLEDEPGEIF